MIADPKPSKIIPLSEQRLRRLISNGYFPSELPPPFSTAKFGEAAPELAKAWGDQKLDKFWTKPEHYSIPRYELARRKLSLVNPVNQLRVAELIANNWGEIREKLKGSHVSEFRPEIVLRGNVRAVTGVDFDGVAKRKIAILGSYGRYVRTDIARFYSSIYTHAIPWAILGKDYVKKNHKTDAFKLSLLASWLKQSQLDRKAKQWAFQLAQIRQEFCQS